MSRETTGGTEMWCPNCERLTICKGISPRETNYKLESGRRFVSAVYEDLQWFRRGRRCLDCENEFITSEIREDFVNELVELREALGEIKKNAEKYIKESESASKSLKKLSGSLNVLQALSIYQNQDADDDKDFSFDDDGDDSEDW